LIFTADGRIEDSRKLKEIIMTDLLQQLQMPQLEAMCEQLYNSQVRYFSLLDQK
jgi:hypothetical protein